MKTTTVKAAVARTGRCGIHPVISQQGDNVLKRKGEKGVVKQETEQKHHSTSFYDPATEATASKDAK